MKKILSPLFSLLCLASVSACASSSSLDLPASFYERKGLESMPRTDLSSMPRVNVVDMGADPSGERACNEAFSKGLEALKTKGGGVLFIPAGRYLFSCPDSTKEGRVSWRPSGLENIHFVGEGPDKSVIFAKWDAVKNSGDPAPYLWSFNSCKEISFRNMGFTVFPYFAMRTPRACEGLFHLAFGGGNEGVQVLNVASDQGRMGILFWGNNKRCWVVGCDVRNTGADAIKFDSCEDVVAAYNYIENNNDDAFSGLRMAVSPSKNNAFLYNTIVYSHGWGRGIPVSGQNHRVEGNWIEAQGMPGLMLHEIGYKDKKVDESEPNGPFQMKGNTLVRANLHTAPGNQLVGHRVSGAIGSYSNRVNGCEISGNLLLANQGAAIGFNKFYSGGVMEGVSIKGNVMALNDGPALLSGCEKPSVLRNVLVEGNKLYANAAKAFPAGQPIESCVVKDNEISEGAGPYSDIYSGVARAPEELVAAPAPDPVAKGPVLNVRDFGAKGDGKACDTEAFIKAFAAIPEDGATLKIPAGKYRIDPLPGKDSLPFTCVKHHLVLKGKANVLIEGEGDASVLLFSSLNHEGLRLIGLRDSAVKGLTFEVVSSSQFRKSRGPLDLVASENVVLERLVSRNSGGCGIRVDASRRVLLSGVRVENAGQAGVSVLGGRHVALRDCVIKNSRDFGVLVGCIGGIARLPQFVSVESCEIDGVREAHGLAFCNGTELSAKGNEISNCYQAGVAAFASNPIFPLEKLTVSGNRIDSCASGELSYMRGAISVFTLPSKERRMKGNCEIDISSNSVSNCKANGVWVDNCNGAGRISVSKNEFSNVAGESVSLDKDQRAQTEKLEID